jgi:Fe2+ transport system protein FeoA
MQDTRVFESKDSSNRCFLDAIPDGRHGIICQLHCKSAALRQRLMELGLNVKAVVRKRSVAGGVICEIGHARFALGRKVCRQIEVVLAGVKS